MKNKSDAYTKIVLTVIAVFLGIIIVRDTDVVSKAHANEMDLSGLKIENSSSANDQVFYIYENSKLTNDARSYRNGSISKSDVPLYIITNTRSISLPD